MSAGGNGAVGHGSACARHEAAVDQIAEDLRLYTAHYRALESRVDAHDRDFGAISNELGKIQRAVGTVVDSVTAMHEDIRQLKPTRAALTSIDLDEDLWSATTSTAIRAADDDTLRRMLETERLAKVRAETALQERERQSERAAAAHRSAGELQLKRWQIIAGVITALATGGGLVSALLHFFGG
jgi:hypothetical protein